MAIDMSRKRSQVFDLLRSRITSLSIPPGKRIDIAALCKELEISPIPVREALKSLTERNLVEAKPNIGYHVTALEDQDVREMFRLRWLMERDALVESIHVVQQDELDDLMVCNQAVIRREVPRHELRGYFDEADMTLHRSYIVGRSGNRMLIYFYDILSDWMKIIMHLNARIAESASEHINLLRCLRERDLDCAQHHLSLHLRNLEEASLPLPATEEEWISRRLEVLGQ